MSNTNKPDEKMAEEFIKSKGITQLTCYTNKSTYYFGELADLFEEYATLKLHAKSEECERLRAINDNLHAQLKNERGFNQLDQQEGIDY